MVIKDSLGNTLHVGDQIAYAVRYGNAGALQHYIIHGFDWKDRIEAYAFEKTDAGYQFASRQSLLSYPSRAVLIKRGNDEW